MSFFSSDKILYGLGILDILLAELLKYNIELFGFHD